MKKTLFILAALASVSALNAGPAEARDYPWCLKQSGDFGPGSCDYTSYAQCKATASGRIADCSANPRLAYGQQQGYDRRSNRRGQSQYY